MQRVMDFNDDEVITPQELVRQAKHKIIVLKSGSSYFILSKVSENICEEEGLKVAWQNPINKNFASGSFGSYQQAIEYIRGNNIFNNSCSDLQVFDDWEDFLLNMEIER